MKDTYLFLRLSRLKENVISKSVRLSSTLGPQRDETEKRRDVDEGVAMCSVLRLDDAQMRKSEEIEGTYPPSS